MPAAATEIIRDGLITIGHPYFHNLPVNDETLVCNCGDIALILILIPRHRLELCQACYRSLAPYLDRNCQLLTIGPGVLA